LTEQTQSPSSRPYRMQRRAEQVDETRQRIVEAAVHLHGTVGPSGTTIAGIAAAAGVTRLTVYRHFPDDLALYSACSAHWLSQQVVPDPARWEQYADPAERLRVGLADLYRFYRDGEAMLLGVYRDKALLPEAIREAIDNDDRAFRELLLAAFEVDGEQERRLRAVIGHATAFWTWRSLTQGLTDDEAVEAMTTLVLAT
jgi:AcrR family transcriptional regulator